MTPTNGHSTQYSFLDRVALLLGGSIEERLEQRVARLEQAVAQGTNGVQGKETVGVLPLESPAQTPTESTAADLGLNMDVAEVLSPSQCNAYLDCSAKWYFKYFRNLPDKTDAKRALGKAVHKPWSRTSARRSRRRRTWAGKNCSRPSPWPGRRKPSRRSLPKATTRPNSNGPAAVLVQKYLVEAAPADHADRRRAPGLGRHRRREGPGLRGPDGLERQDHRSEDLLEEAHGDQP